MPRISELFAPRDMTIGRPAVRIAEFAVPMVLGNFTQQLYNTADSIIVGRYVGDNALAAVGAAMPILNLLLALFVGIAVGAGIMVAQYFGAKDRARLSKSIGNCLALSLAATAIVMTLGPLLTRPLLLLLDTPDSIRDWSVSYLNIFFIGSAGFFFYNILAGILRGMGDSLSALLFLLLTTALNIGLDIWFVAGFGLGVPGVALATVLAQDISAVLCFLKLRRMKNVFDLNRQTLRPRKKYILNICRLGIPAGITQAIISVAMLFVQNLTNSFGEMMIACNTIVMRVDGFAIMPNFSFGNALSTFTGQNVGAGKLDRINQGAKEGTWLAVACSTAITLLLLLFGRSLMGMFTQTPELIAMGGRMMRIIAAGYIAMAISQCMSGVMRGAGDTLTPMWLSIITIVVIRIPLAYGLIRLTRSPEYPLGRPESIFVSLLIAWVLGSVLNILAYRLGGWRKNLDLLR